MNPGNSVYYFCNLSVSLKLFQSKIKGNKILIPSSLCQQMYEQSEKQLQGKASRPWLVVSVSLIPSKLNFMVGEKFKTSESLGHKETLCVALSYCYSGTFWHCPWLFLPDSWQLNISLRGQKLSECIFIHLANVLFPLCLSQPKHAINGRHRPECPGSHRSPHPCLNIW